MKIFSTSLTSFLLIWNLIYSASAAQSGTLTIAFLGDSLTEGYGINESEAYPALVGKALEKKGLAIKIINAGISGATSASAPSRMKWLLKGKPDWVVLALGANDGLRGLSPEAMKKNLLTAIEIAEKAQVRVLFAGMKVPPNLGKSYSGRFEKVFQEIAREKKSIVFLPFLLDRVGGEVELNLPDGIHPNPKGHEVMANTVLKILEPRL